MSRAFLWSRAPQDVITVLYISVIKRYYSVFLDIRSMVPYDQGGRVSIYGRISPNPHVQPPVCIDT